MESHLIGFGRDREAGVQLRWIRALMVPIAAPRANVRTLRFARAAFLLGALVALFVNLGVYNGTALPDKPKVRGAPGSSLAAR